MRVVSNKNEAMAIMTNRAVYAQYLLAHAIKRDSLKTTPLKTHQLRASIKLSSSVEDYKVKQTIKWDQPYAAYQERGMRYDGTHVIKNYTTAGTGPWYARDAVKRGMKNLNQYWAEANQTIR